MEALHLCENCALKRRPITNLKVPIDPVDAGVFERISTMVTNTKQALDIPAPENMTKEERKAYFKNVVESDNNSSALINEWWTMARQKYGIPTHARFDNETQEFYECVDENGVPNKTADFVPKKIK